MRAWVGLFIIPLFAVPASARSGSPGSNPTLASGSCSPVIELLATKPSAAYALRRVNCTYIGPIVKVERLSDNLTLDVGAIGNTLDTASISAFCVSTTCTIDEWYDQTINGRHMTAAAGDAAQTPLIWASGAYANNINGKPAALSNATYNNYVQYNPGSPDTAIIGTTTGAMFAVGNAASGLAGTPGDAAGTLTGSIAAIFPSSLGSLSAGLAFIQGGTVFSPPSMVGDRQNGGGAVTDVPVTYTYTTDGIFGQRWNNADPTPVKAYINGGTPQTSATIGSNSASDGICVPSNGCSVFTRQYTGNVSEVWIFPTEPSLSDSNFLGGNIASWFGLTWTPITL